ncbi:MAG: DUF2314 domain-containing protein [Prevotellaceae bacterium]|jgi:uncharacterized protein YegJ (DUF2314 family)|nr:DUF2314 domain-containing protein [Prevotellaceae bacterium]
MEESEYIFQHKIILIIVIIVAIVASVYFSSIPEETTKYDIAYNTYNDDIELNFAAKSAKSTLNYFENALLSNDTALYFFTFIYNDIKKKKYVWVYDVYLADNEYYGYIHDKDVKIDKNNIIDWLYLKNDSCYGGFYIQALKNRMTEKEQKDIGIDDFIFAKDNIIPEY